MTADLLALLAVAHPNATQGDLLAMLDAVPDSPAAKTPRKPAQARSGSRPRTDASMERRRSWAASGRMPPRLACRFTLAEQAVLAVVAAEVAKQDTCGLTLDHIAALAGVCRSSVKNAIRQAQRLGFVRIEVRRRSAWRNDPNVITIISPEWLTWLRMRTSRRREVSGGGGKSVTPTNTSLEKKGFRRGESGTHEQLLRQTSPAARSQVPRGAGLPPRTRHTRGVAG